MLIIGINGLARAGKDTFASFLEDSFKKRGRDVQRYSFAMPLKESLKVMLGWSDDHVYGDLKEQVDPIYGFTPRKAMQTIGTEWGREMMDGDIWINAAKQYMRFHGKEDTVWIIPDLRFDNEANYVCDNGGIMFRIIRDDVESINGIEGHASEGGLSSRYLDLCQLIDNNYDVGRLKTQADVIAGAWSQ